MEALRFGFRPPTLTMCCRPAHSNSRCAKPRPHFNALDLSKISFVPQVDDGFNLVKVRVQDAMADGTLRYIILHLMFRTKLFRMDFTKDAK